MTITHHDDVIQGSEEWHALRCGLLTASEMKLIITPTLKIASNDKKRCHMYELMAQRISGYVEPSYVSDDMLRGQEDEIEALMLYGKSYTEVTACGFITNDKWGFNIGCSPDGMVGADGMVEAKSRRQKYQVETVASNAMPEDFIIQVQTELLVSERKWCDFVSYSGGFPMFTTRIYPDAKIQEAIVYAATAFEAALTEKMAAYYAVLNDSASRLLPTKRKVEQEMFLS